MPIEVVSETTVEAGYIVREERLSGEEYGVPNGEAFNIQSAYTLAGHYIGDPEAAHQLVALRGIKPELVSSEDSKSCIIGFCAQTQKWYGWSHRAICGFGIGDKLFEGSFDDGDDYTPFVQHGRQTITTLDEARQAAVNFAEYVS